MKIICLCVFLLCSGFATAQENFPKVSLQVTEKSIPEVITMLEDQTSYTFYYIDSWIQEEKITANITNTFLPEALDAIFSNTSLNYYLSPDKKVILTKNTLIYDSLPEGFFNDEQEKTTVQKEADDTSNKQSNFNPVFLNASPISTTIETTTISIGKARKDALQKTATISGYIKDKKNNTPIEDVSIKLSDKNYGTTTNEQGYFELTLPIGLNSLVIKSLGYAPKKYNVLLYNDGQLSVFLKEQVENLGEVVINTNKDKNIKTEITGTVDVDVKKIKNIPLVLGERDIFKVAATLPGITTAGEGSSGFNIRGGKTDQNLILLDGGVLYNPVHFFGIFSAINPFTTSKVTIYKGNIPSEFGGRLSSVIDIETKNGNTKKLSGEASIGPVTGNVSIEIPISKEKSSVVIGARSTYSDWILKALDNEELKNSTANYYDIVAKYHSKINEDNTLEATAYHSKDKFSITSDSIFGYTNSMASVNWTHTFNEKIKGKLLVSNSQYAFSIDFDQTGNRDFSLGYKNNETHLKYILKHDFSNNHFLTYGVSEKLYVINPGKIKPVGTESLITPVTIDKERGLESALFISDKITVNKKLILNLGLRVSNYLALGAGQERIYATGLPKNENTLVAVKQYDANEVIQSYLNPEVRISTRYLLKNNLSIKAGFNTTAQYIHALSNNTTASPTDTWKLSDSNIKPQKATQYALGIYKNDTEGMYELSLEGFYKRFKDVLDYKTGSQFLLNETLETEVIQGVGKSYGIEFLIKKLKGRLNGWVSYTYSRAFFKMDSPFAEETINNGAYFPANFDKPHNLNFITNFKITERFSFSGNFIYQTGRPVTVPIGNFTINNSEFVLYSDRNAFRIPDYYRLDLSFNIEGTHKIKKLAHSFWNISVYNVLGRNNPYSVFFVTENGEVKAYQSAIFAIPVPTISYNLKF